MTFSKSKFLTIFLLFCTLLHLGFAIEEAMDNPIAQSEIGQHLPYAPDCCSSCHSGTCCSGGGSDIPPYGCVDNPPKCSGSICHPSPPSGQCQGPCQGQCQGPCQGPCQGQCQGSCQGQCQGPCQGQCQGSCQSQCQGSCQGQCQGSCQGQCQGSCQGQCQGSCQGQCQGSCQGQCQGSCQSCGCWRGNVRVEEQDESSFNQPTSESMSPKNDGN